MNATSTNDRAELERNKAVALRFKKYQGTKDMPRVEKEVLAPNYQRVRGGNFHLASNAHGQGWPEPGLYLRKAFPDRVDIIEHVIAEGDRVGLLFRLNATHTGNLFGIPPTGRKVDVYEVALLRIVDGRMVEGWFMMDEAELLRQLGAKLPVRNDGRIIAPPIPETGLPGDAMIEQMLREPRHTIEQHNKLIAARSKASAPIQDKATGYAQRRHGFQHLHDYGRKHGAAQQSLRAAFPDRHDKVDFLLAEGDQVWMKFQVHGTHDGSLYGLPATGKRVGVPEIGIAHIADGRWQDSWYFGDELGMLLQLGVPNLLFG